MDKYGGLATLGISNIIPKLKIISINLDKYGSIATLHMN